MSKKVLIISTSIRPNSNSELLANAFADGARKSGNEVELVSLKDKTIGFCKGCLACQKLGRCVVKDDANEITEKLLNAEVVVWATPIYYYEMSGQMKTMIDRANSLYPRDYQFRDVYLLRACRAGLTASRRHSLRAKYSPAVTTPQSPSRAATSSRKPMKWVRRFNSKL